MVDVDTVVIGSGMGGLTAAVALAQAGQKVLVLEQHYVPGGWTHSFALEGHRFSPGVHYLGQLQEGGQLRATFEGLGLGEFLQFFELNPDGYDHVRAGRISFDFCAGKEQLIERLCARFPHERRGIVEFINLSKAVRDELGELGQARGILGALAGIYRARHLARFGLYSLDRILRDRIADPDLRGVLAVQCGDHGLPPSRAPFVLHATVALHYLEGAWYPKGGGSALPKAMTRALTRAGGVFKLETRVAKILIEGRRAIGVQLADGTQLRAQHVVSNADPVITYRRLIGDEHLPGRLHHKLARTRWSTSAVSLFFAVEADVKALGLDSGNYWLCPGLDAERAYRAMTRPDLFELDPLPGIFVSITSLKDPSSFNGEHHTAEAFIFVPYELFEKYERSASGARSPEYQALKQQIAARMIAAIEQGIPGLTRKVVFQDLGTPLTNVHFVAATRGNIYGTEKILRQLGPFGFPQASIFEGLTLCGASTIGHGVPGAAISGLQAAALVLGCRAEELLRQGQPKLRTSRADAWLPSTRGNEIGSTSGAVSDYPPAQP